MKKSIVTALPYGVVKEMQEHLFKNGNQPEDLLNIEHVYNEFSNGRLTQFFDHFVRGEEAKKNCNILFINFNQIVSELVSSFEKEFLESHDTFTKANEQASEAFIGVLNNNSYVVTSVYTFKGEELVTLYDKDYNDHFVAKSESVTLLKKVDEEVDSDEEDVDIEAYIKEMFGEYLNESKQEEVPKSLDEVFSSLIDELVEVNRKNSGYDGENKLVNALEKQVTNTVVEIFANLNDEEKQEMIEEIKKDVAKAKLQ